MKKVGDRAAESTSYSIWDFVVVSLAVNYFKFILNFELIYMPHAQLTIS